MTRKEANKLIMKACERTWNEKTCKEIFKALEQEPCEAVSREDALKSLIDNTDFEGWELSQALEAIEKLPSVTPQQKTGRWILSGGYWRCSECKEKALLKLDKSKGGCREYEPVRSKHCPSCGIKMQESEDKE